MYCCGRLGGQLGNSSAKNYLQRGDELRDIRIPNPVIQRLCFAAEGQQAFVAHAGQVLGEGGLAQWDLFQQGAHGHFFVLDRKSVV